MKSAGRIAHATSDFFSDADIGGIQVNVVGNQRLPRSNHHRAGRTHDFWPKIGFTVGVSGDGFFDSLKFTPADILQINSVRSCCSFFIKVNRDIQVVCHPFAQTPGDFNALLHGGIRDRNKGHHIGSPQAGVFALVVVEVNQLSRPGNALISGFFHAFRVSDKGQNRAIVIQIGVAV